MAKPSVSSSESKLKTDLSMRSEVYGTDLQPTELDQEKLREALRKEDQVQRGKAGTDERKRK